MIANRSAMNLDLPTVRLFRFFSTGRIINDEHMKAAGAMIRLAIPWVERLKGLVLRQFLAGPFTVRDLMERLGKKRPDQIYRMMLVINKREAREGYFMDRFQRGLDCVIDVKAQDYVTPPYTQDELFLVCDKLDRISTEPLTERDQSIIGLILADTRLHFPNEMMLGIHRGRP